MKYILIILISLFISLPSFANPSGKGLICENVMHNYRKIGFLFFDDNFRWYYFYDKKDVVTIDGDGGKIYPWYYTTSPDSIKLQLGHPYLNPWSYILNRKSLILKKLSHKKGLLESTYQCTIKVSEHEFLKELHNIQKAYQKELDLELKGNKI
jgi:hypothetical protein